MIKGFRDFILRGNVIDLAVAVVIGAAFSALVAAFGSSLITPVVNSLFSLLGLSANNIGGEITLPGEQVISLGVIISAAITFLITAAIVYFIFVAPMNAARGRLARQSGVEDDDEPVDIALLREIRDLLAERKVADQELQDAASRN